MESLTLELARVQFALSAGVHFLFPATTLGIAFFLVVAEGFYLATNNEVYRTISKLGVKTLALIFALGVATGIVLPFAFGTNWANFIDYVGAVFGVHLTLEAVVAFMLEAIFLGILLFGRNRVSKGAYFVAALMVFLGSHLSGFFIVSANSWMQTPFHSIENLAAGIPVPATDGFFIQQTLSDGTVRQVMDATMLGQGGVVRIVMTDVLKVIFNPSTMIRFVHTVVACWITGAVVFAAIAAFYMLRNPHNETSRTMFKLASVIGIVAALAQPLIGHEHIMETKAWQPNKNAAMEGVFKTTDGAALIATGWVDPVKRETYGIPIPGMLSFFEEWNFTARVAGLDDNIAKGKAENIEYLKYEPDVQLTFQSFHAMVAMGIFMMFIFAIAIWHVIKKKWDAKKWVWRLMLVQVPMPLIAVVAGWFGAEAGRQPWVVYGLMKTADGVSNIPPEYAAFSLIAYTLVYISLFFILFKWLPRIIREGMGNYMLPGPGAETGSTPAANKR